MEVLTAVPNDKTKFQEKELRGYLSMNALPNKKQCNHLIHKMVYLCVGMVTGVGITLIPTPIDFRNFAYEVYKTAVCAVVPCNTDLPEIGADASNNRYIGRLTRSYGQIRYTGEEIGTTHRVESRSCKVLNAMGGRRYICLSRNGKTYDITYRDAIPWLLQIKVDNRLEELYF
jgi:hypothetical protein